MAWLGSTRTRRGKAGGVRFGLVWLGEVRLGEAQQAGQWRGRRGKSGRGKARSGGVSHGRRGMAGQGMARSGGAWRGKNKKGRIVTKRSGPLRRVGTEMTTAIVHESSQDGNLITIARTELDSLLADNETLHRENDLLTSLTATVIGKMVVLRKEAERLERSLLVAENRIADLEGAISDGADRVPEEPPTECQFITGRTEDSRFGPGETSICGKPIVVRINEAPICSDHQGWDDPDRYEEDDVMDEVSR